jgi:hypothetical protein
LAHAVQGVRSTQMHPDTPVWRTIWRMMVEAQNGLMHWVLAPLGARLAHGTPTEVV